MILESPFDYLVEEIWGDELVNVCPGEVVCEGLD